LQKDAKDAPLPAASDAGVRLNRKSIEFMNKSYKIIIATVITIFLGAIGSGVWQYILEPIISSSSKVVLDIATLGIESFKNNLYQEIAKGFHEKASYNSDVKFNILLIFAFVLYTYNLFIEGGRILEERRKIMNKYNVLYNKIESLNNGVKYEPELPSLNEIDIEINKLSQDKKAVLLKKLMPLPMIFSILLLIPAVYVSSIRDLYVNDAVTHYKQTIKIITPFVLSNDLAFFNSRFSQIKTSADYSTIIGDLNKVATENNIIFPKFEIW
jgi:hypothetical protein